jgi:hypothetical protein
LAKVPKLSKKGCKGLYTSIAAVNHANIQILPNMYLFLLFRASQAPLYLKADSDEETIGPVDIKTVGSRSCVTRFIRMLLTLVSNLIKTI